MKLNKNITDHQEIDLIDILIIVSKNKTKIFLITFIFLILMIGYIKIQKPLKSEYEVMSEIIPISTFEEFEYQNYNSFLTNSSSVIIKYPIKMKDENFIVNELSMNINDTSFKKIDQKHLIDLFMQKIYDQKFLSRVAKESKIINKEDYKDDLQYNKSITSFISSIKFSPTTSKNTSNQNFFNVKDGWKINFLANNKEKSKNFLINLELFANLEVKKYLEENFNSLIANQVQIKKFNIEDIELELSKTIDESFIRRLELEKSKLIKQKDLERLINAFNTTPVKTSVEFSAAKILVDSSTYKNLSQQSPSKTTLILLSIISGTIFGALYVLVSTAIQKRKKL